MCPFLIVASEKMDNFDDFMNVSKGPSKLASLFARNKNINVDNPSLIYTAPKQPKAEESPHRSSSNIGLGGVKLEIILPKTVRAYKLVEGVYEDLGKMGLTLLGCKFPPIYQLLLYKTRNEVLCKIKLLQSFTFSVHENNYASFYSESQQNFSVMFESSSDLREFARQLILCKANSEPLKAAITQDLSYGDSSSSTDVANIDVKYTCSKIMADETLVVVEEKQKTLNANDQPPWIKALSAMRVGNEKAVILPGNLSEPWTHLIGQETKLIVEVTRVSSVAPESNRSYEVVEESTMESSNEESSIKERGSVLKEALSVRSQKSNLLSRMARMGQATLPLRGAIAADPSDSEDESSPSPKPRIRSKPVPLTETVSPFREPAIRWSQHTAPNLAQPLVAAAAQPVALYQPSVQSQFLVQRSDIPGYTSLVSSASSALPSPAEASLSAHFTESRTQAAELRMGLGKVADKVDLVLNKIQDLQAPPRQSFSQSATVDPAGIISSIQSLVCENEALRNKVEDQRQKLDAQNERLYHLLEFSQRTMEQKSLSSQQQSDAESKITADLEASYKKEKTLSEALAEATNKILTLEKQVEELKCLSESSVEDNKLLKSKLDLLEEEKSRVTIILEETTNKMLRAEDSLKKLEVETAGNMDKFRIDLKLQEEISELLAKLRDKESAAFEMQEEIERLKLFQKLQRELLEVKIAETEKFNCELVQLREANKKR